MQEAATVFWPKTSIFSPRIECNEKCQYVKAIKTIDAQFYSWQERHNSNKRHFFILFYFFKVLLSQLSWILL